MKRSLKQVEDLLSCFDLLLSCIEKDCGRVRYFSAVKAKVKDTRKALRDIPIPRGMK